MTSLSEALEQRMSMSLQDVPGREHDIKVRTEEREELYNLSETVRDLSNRQIRAGLVNVASLHTTSAIFINEWQEALVHDVKAYLSSLINKDDYYRHNDPRGPIATATMPIPIFGH